MLRERSVKTPVAAAALVAIHLVLVVDGATRHSVVFDEVVYPTSGYSYWTTGDYRMNAEHPPFLKLWTALPWLGSGLDARSTAGWEEGNEWLFGRTMIYGGGRHASLLFRARMMIALLSGLLALGVFFVARSLGGESAGLLAVGLYAFDPLVVAHAGFATTDLGGACFYFLAALAFLPAVLRGGSLRLLLAGALLGLALASKFSNLPLVVVLALLALGAGAIARRGGGAFPAHPTPDRPWAVLRRALVIGAVAPAVLVATYGSMGASPFLEGVSMLRYHGEVGHPSYAFGIYGTMGRWWYFPAVWAVKTPIPLLLASSAGIVALGRRLGKDPLRVGMVLVAPSLIVVAAVGSSLNLGVRHLLPLTPFLAVAGGVALAEIASRGRGFLVAALALLLWLAAGTVRVHPHEMAYANEVAGGPARLWHHLADSNVDWGQDLPALAEVVSRFPLRRLYLGYFGTADPKAYGLPYCWTSSMRMIEPRCDDGPDANGKEWIAISVTNLLDVYTERRDAHAWLRERPMTAFPGYSIALYDITGDAEAHRQLGEVAMRFGEMATAEPALRRSLDLAPENGRTHLDLARILAAQSRLDEALTECSAAERLLSEPDPTALCVLIREGALKESSPPSRPN